MVIRTRAYRRQSVRKLLRKLPDDVICIVFSAFTDESALHLASQVCRQWQKCAKACSVWKILFHKRWETDYCPKMLGWKEKWTHPKEMFLSRHQAEKDVLNLPGQLRERRLDCTSPASDFVSDKIFASVWLSDSSVIVGTKDNKLVNWNVDENTKTGIPLPDVPTTWGSYTSAGIHAVQINPAGTLLACGGINPADLVVMELPSFKPVSVLQGHKDWLFACAWLSDELVVTASRDASIKLWSVRGNRRLGDVFEDGCGHDHLSTTAERASPLHGLCHEGRCLSTGMNGAKVRDLKLNRHTGKLCTFATDKTVRLWCCEPTGLVSGRALPLLHDEPPMLPCGSVTVDEERGAFLIGCERRAHVLDARQAGVVHEFNIASEEGSYLWCIRSMAINHHLLSIGDEQGRLYFFDVRMRRFVAPSPDQQFLRAERRVPNTNNRNVPAIFTHEYDPTGRRLFTGGGPALICFSGRWASVWEPWES